MSTSLGQRIKHLRGDARRTAIEDVIRLFESSGKTRAQFCRDVGIATVTLGRWQAELKAEAPKQPSAQLVEIGAPQHGGFEVTLPGGTVIRVPHDFNEHELQRLVRTLAKAC